MTTSETARRASPREGLPSGYRDVEAVYTACYGRLVAVLGAVAQDRHEAEDAVQHAFARPVDKWDTVQAYDDVEAWLRKVAFGQISNRRRTLSRSLRAMARRGTASSTPGPTGDAADLRRALRALPLAQRQVVVLRHLGLSTEEMADCLGVPTGTVTSRLSRARAALIPLLGEEPPDHG